MIVSVPASAPIVPPETGASSTSMECAASAAASSRASAGGAVDMSMQSEPAASPSARPPGPSVARRTAAGDGSIVIAASAPRAASRALAQRSTPSTAASGSRSKPRTSWPAATSRAVIGRPMRPSPTNAMTATSPLS